MSSKRRLTDGQQHAKITQALVFPCLVFSLLATGSGFYSAAGALGCIAGLILSPDLDQPMITDSEWRIIKIPILGWLLGTLWVAFWLPYSFACKHRGISHWPVLGTITRLLYLALPAIGIWWFLGWPPPTLEMWLAFVWFGFGLMVADCGHFIRDWWGWEL